MANSGKVSAELLAGIKNDLDVTWDDEATDTKYRRLIEDGMAYLGGKIGGAPDFERAGEARTLLREYVRYARDEAQDVFETNYLSRILAAQNDRRLSAYVASTKPAEQSDQSDV